ncbi:MAG: YdeI/OmpD-associated family protein [Cellulomonas sp.]
MDDAADRVHPETADAWRAWLVENHTRTAGVWFVSWKKHTGRPVVPYDAAVTEALAFGWIDSKAATLDDARAMLWYSPRRPKSAWSRPNKERVARLLAEGRMAPAGQRMVDLAQASGTWSLLDDVENLIVPDDLAEAFDALPGAAAHWESFPRSVRRGILEWIVQAKRPETRANRVRETADRAVRGERANQWR